MISLPCPFPRRGRGLCWCLLSRLMSSKPRSIWPPSRTCPRIRRSAGPLSRCRAILIRPNGSSRTSDRRYRSGGSAWSASQEDRRRLPHPQYRGRSDGPSISAFISVQRPFRRNPALRLRRSDFLTCACGGCRHRQDRSSSFQDSSPDVSAHASETPSSTPVGVDHDLAAKPLAVLCRKSVSIGPALRAPQPLPRSCSP